MVASTRRLPRFRYARSGWSIQTEYASRDGAWAGAEELKERRPMLQIGIYDVTTKSREEVRLPVS
ncbi:hypothetical protein E4K65_34765 [Bradyrhizobium niftali]|jgi:hypothetical protein|uniref:Uncharacterized protein n=1 Tax=Bradyrhizobium niftali TaxID=2560055 RepID=A0A4Y9LF26_9BRAD|nr:hypothetical protein E4K65_34765 [Bradyrhizobium niftali]